MTKLDELQKLLSHKKSKGWYANRLKVSELVVNELLKQLRAREPLDAAEEDTIVQNLEKGTLRATKLVSVNPSTPEEIMAIHGIDPKKWKLSQFWSKQKKDKWLVSALFTAIKIQEDLPSQKQVILDEIKEYISEHKKEVGKHPVATKHRSSAECLYEICLPDLHFGKLAHKEEVGEDYDIKIATARAQSAVDELLKRTNTSDIERILFPIGNDLFNVDNQISTTTAGTRQDCDTRFHKMVKTTRRVLVEIIDQLSTIAPVDIPIVVGNHDTITAFMMGEIIEAIYHNNPKIRVDNSASQRKYYQYYFNGFQFTHGNNENHKDLGLIFATEQPRLWADTKFRFCQLGHFHHEKKINYVSLDSHQGFQIEILPSLSGSDAWHNSKGYMANKSAKSFLYHQTQGEVGSFKFTVTQ